MSKINWKSVGIKAGIITVIGLFIVVFIMTGLIKDLSNVTLDLAKQNSEIVEWVNKIESNVSILSRNDSILFNYIHELSDIPNEKRKAIFELKIQQDSVLINLLRGDMNTNQKILKLLDDKWMYNTKTKFKSLKTK